MTKLEELKAELQAAEYDLANTHPPRISSDDIEDVSDRYQERLEYNWWVAEQEELIKGIEAEIKSLS